MEEAVTCGVCMEVYSSEDDRVPRALSCLHTFCTKCIAQISRQPIVAPTSATAACPTCRKESVLEHGVKGMLCNYQLLDAAKAWALQELATSPTAPQIMCEKCEDPAVNHCGECNEFLCTDCSGSHLKQKLTRGHALHTVAEFKDAVRSGAGSGRPSAPRPEYCRDHPRPSELHELTLFCITCDRPICRDCIVVDHSKHEFTFLEYQIKKERTVIVGMVDEVKKRSETVVAAAAAVAAMRTSVVTRERTATAEVRALFQATREAVDQRERDCVAMVEAESQQKCKMLDVQHEGLTSFVASLQSSCEYVQNTLDRGSDCQMMLAKPVLTARLQELQQQELTLTATAVDTLLVDDSSAEQIITMLTTQLGSVTACDVAPEHCTVIGAGVGAKELSLEESMVLTVALCDRQGEPVRIPVESLRAVLQVQVQATEVLPVETDSTETNTAAYTYTPSTVGEVTIDVRVLGRHVQGSPFRVTVVDCSLDIDSEILDAKMKRILAGMLGAGKRWRARKLCTSTTKEAHIVDFTREVKNCNGTRTLVVIRESNTGYVFGGYVHGPYGTHRGHRLLVENFVFTLGNVTGSPVKLVTKLTGDPNGIYGRYEGANYGFAMGEGFDLCIHKGESYANHHSYTTVAPGYTAPGPINNTTLSGVPRNFIIQTVEVFTIVD